MDRKWLRTALIVLTLAIMQFTYWGEKIPLERGAGWDGQQYREEVQDVVHMLLDGRIDAYHMHRILPFVFSHGLLGCVGLPPTEGNAMTVTIVANLFIVFCSMMLFFRIADTQRWSRSTEVIGFSSVFFTVGVLKIWGYYPFLTDEMALFLALLSCFHYLTNQRKGLIADGVLGMLVWPMISLVVLVLVIFPMPASSQAPNDQTTKQPNDQAASHLLRLLFALWYPLLFAAFVVYKMRVHPGMPFAEMFALRPSQGMRLAMVAVAATAVFFYLATRWITLDVSYLFKQLTDRRNLLRIVAGCATFVVVYKVVELHSAPAMFSVGEELAQMAQLPASDILVFLEAPFLYWGPFFLLLMASWPSVCRAACREGSLGLLITVLMSLAFLVDIETRKHISFFPFLLVLALNHVDGLRLRSWVAPVFAVLSLLMSALFQRPRHAGGT